MVEEEPTKRAEHLVFDSLPLDVFFCLSSGWTTVCNLIWISDIPDRSSPTCLCTFRFLTYTIKLMFDGNWVCYVYSLLVLNLHVWCDLTLIPGVWFHGSLVFVYFWVCIWVLSFNLDCFQNSKFPSQWMRRVLWKEGSCLLSLILRKVFLSHFSKICFLQILWMFIFLTCCCIPGAHWYQLLCKVSEDYPSKAEFINSV